MSGKVIFYSLSKKFLEREQDLPAEGPARQVIYQTLALGHHIGVIDCLKTALSCPLDGFDRWVGKLPPGEARRKLEGVFKFGEIMIDASHTQLLALALSRAEAGFEEDELTWTRALMSALAAIEAEPAMYLMVKRRD
ncbi:MULTISPECIES: formate hydrogenlyase maturation HycH family protein [unclassified Paludibacterium]|uniref:formate hydrogenlyase maturation HycH family protein n=1 Tax=unclassified Paludibacterium TaxID=2618429 RepID=UPI001C04762D|nr:formate hydrogenlyase maturation HycH family protein [Paludibacterium sp. B53371]BEV70893.1 formate hydrogenlyase maturation HycH family protein [Paludibacterium sp. THUN1379]